jgi:RNA polymerase sigma-70 factor, ECF subfamily
MEFVSGVRAQGDQPLPGAIIARAREGDAAARQELARGHYDFVYRFVLASVARGGSEADAADITQSTFLRAFEALETYAGEGSFGGWLLTIAKRAASDFYRGRGTAPSSAEPVRDDDLRPAAESRTPLDDVLRLEEDLRVRRALTQLSADHREVLACRIVSELPIQETARMMERSEPAVKMLQLRAVRALTEALSGDGSKRGGEGN